MKHYKEKPDCLVEEPYLQPDYLTQEIKSKHLNEGEDYINLKFCAKCPHCETINEKRSKCNLFECNECHKMFCYICNKPISGPEHYQGKN
jgi:ribosomal protein L37AE/L43A